MVLALPLAGCGSAGVDEGQPSGDLKSVVPINTISTDMSGRAFSDQKKAQAKAAAAKESDAAAAPAEKKE